MSESQGDLVKRTMEARDGGCHMPETSAIGRQKQVDFFKFKTSPVYVVSSRLARAT